mmetsp:Transcript_24864/g.64157  ORF Transcript_24864/g.64157 Transcript_24864/m.64157 type:complete len:252 (-) Transcript_24864:59-814(-)
MKVPSRGSPRLRYKGTQTHCTSSHCAMPRDGGLALTRAQPRDATARRPIRGTWKPAGRSVWPTRTVLVSIRTMSLRRSGTALPPWRAMQRHSSRMGCVSRLAQECRKIQKRQRGGAAKPLNRATQRRSSASPDCTSRAKACLALMQRLGAGTAKLPSRATAKHAAPSMRQLRPALHSHQRHETESAVLVSELGHARPPSTQRLSFRVRVDAPCPMPLPTSFATPISGFRRILIFHHGIDHAGRAGVFESLS